MVAESQAQTWSCKISHQPGFVFFADCQPRIFAHGFVGHECFIRSSERQADRLFSTHNRLYFFMSSTGVIIFLIIALLFAIIFKVLPDGKIKWRDAFTGAAFTSILFIIGKGAISYYLGRSNLGATYGLLPRSLLFLPGFIILPSFYILVQSLPKFMRWNMAAALHLMKQRFYHQT